MTAIARDGLLTGPDLELLAQAAAVAGGPEHVIASAGVSSLEDVRALAAAGYGGAILGRALYEGRVDLAEALAHRWLNGAGGPEPLRRATGGLASRSGWYATAAMRRPACEVVSRHMTVSPDRTSGSTRGLRPRRANGLDQTRTTVLLRRQVRPLARPAPDDSDQWPAAGCSLRCASMTRCASCAGTSSYWASAWRKVPRPPVSERSSVA